MRLVVIGGVAAGMSAAARARRSDSSLEITVLEKGPVISYGACGLPYYVEGRVGSLDQLIVYTPEYFRRERNVDVRTGAEVAGISHARREVTIAGGDRLRYDKLVIATGARASRIGPPDAFVLHTIEDAAKLREHVRAKRPARAAIIGAGYIGLEVAEALRANGVAVVVYEASSDVLGRHDPALTKAIGRHLERFRVDLRLNHPYDGAGYDLVISAAGLKPNAEIAADAGIELGRTGAIRVNERMETNLAGVYAAGDCVETTHLVTGKPAWIPLGTTANKMGRVAGACAAGGRERFPGVVGTAIVRVCGLGVGLTGLSVVQARSEGFDPASARIEARDKPAYFRGRPTTVELVADRPTGRLLGGSVIGEEGVAGRTNVIATALANRMKVDEFEMLDLAYAPPFATVWDPVLIAAQQLLKAL